MNDSISYVRPLGTLIFALSLVFLTAWGKEIPGWAPALAIFAWITWFVDRTLWKFFGGNNGK